MIWKNHSIIRHCDYLVIFGPICFYYTFLMPFGTSYKLKVSSSIKTWQFLVFISCLLVIMKQLIRSRFCVKNEILVFEEVTMNERILPFWSWMSNNLLWRSFPISKYTKSIKYIEFAVYFLNHVEAFRMQHRCFREEHNICFEIYEHTWICGQRADNDEIANSEITSRHFLSSMKQF